MAAFEGCQWFFYRTQTISIVSVLYKWVRINYTKIIVECSYSTSYSSHNYKFDYLQRQIILVEINFLECLKNDFYVDHSLEGCWSLSWFWLVQTQLQSQSLIFFPSTRSDANVIIYSFTPWPKKAILNVWSLKLVEAQNSQERKSIKPIHPSIHPIHPSPKPIYFLVSTILSNK